MLSDHILSDTRPVTHAHSHTLAHWAVSISDTLSGGQRDAHVVHGWGELASVFSVLGWLESCIEERWKDYYEEHHEACYRKL